MLLCCNYFSDRFLCFFLRGFLCNFGLFTLTRKAHINVLYRSYLPALFCAGATLLSCFILTALKRRRYTLRLFLSRGIRDFYKRKSIFTWIEKQKADIVFLQETYSTPEVVNEWKFQYRGQMFHSHGSNHSRRVLVLINENLQFEVKNLNEDIHCRFVAIEALIQESSFCCLTCTRLQNALSNVTSSIQFHLSWKK